MRVRREEKEDFQKIYDLVKVAFQTARVKDGDEQDYMAALRSSEGYLPELALVAEENGELIGHIMLTKVFVTRKDEQFEYLLLSPLSVLLDSRNKGVGAMLVREDIVKAKAMGYTAVFVVGDPDYYGRFGFRPAANFGVKTPGIPKKNAMALELEPGALEKARGGKVRIS